MLLELVDASGGYGTTPILRNISLGVAAGEIVALLGRNGSGKTTAFKYAMGLLDRFGGTVSVEGEAVAHRPESRARAGLAYVPQGRFVFPRLTVVENISAVAIAHGRRAADAVDRALAMFPALAPRMRALAGELSGGQQQMLAIVRALAMQPRVLLLDEPTEGVQPSIVDELSLALLRLNAMEGLSILVAEQDLNFALDLASRAYIMNRGGIEREAATSQLRHDREGIQELLGV
jgi:ABC-type branched-subunit amino acid transport system ATPase component